MQVSTLERLQCPISACKGSIALVEGSLDSGSLGCKKCKTLFPILAGVAIVIPDPEGYILDHVKGISRWVKDSDIPKAIRKDYLELKKELAIEHIEEDLESDRVNALYFMTHFLNAGEAVDGVESTQIRELIHKYWDHGPMSVVAGWIRTEASKPGQKSMVELGCGVGGLAGRLGNSVSNYLGVDSSFASIALARAIYLGGELESQGIPADLIQGPLSRTLDLKNPKKRLQAPGNVDFIVGDLELPPLSPAQFDGCVVLNAIDMMHHPQALPAIQKRLIKREGWAIQAAPYVWHEQVVKNLKVKKLTGESSSQVVESFYQAAGFRILKSETQIPWIFFKHRRQVELYSVHALLARV